MEAFVDAGVEALARLRDEYRKAIEGLSVEALNWKPGPEMNSLAVLVTHAWSSTRGWLGAAAGRTVERDRDAEFRVQGATADELAALIDRCAGEARGALMALDGADLSATVTHRNREVTAAWAAVHALEHCAEHAGHAGLTRQLWEQRQRS